MGHRVQKVSTLHHVFCAPNFNPCLVQSSPSPLPSPFPGSAPWSLQLFIVSPSPESELKRSSIWSRFPSVRTNEIRIHDFFSPIRFNRLSFSLSSSTLLYIFFIPETPSSLSPCLRSHSTSDPTKIWRCLRHWRPSRL